MPILTLASTVDNAAHNDTANPEPRQLLLSGTITIPQRCYLNIEGSGTIDFGSIYSNAPNGMIKQQQGAIVTTCHNVPNNTKQYIKVSGRSGGNVTKNGFIYEFVKIQMLREHLVLPLALEIKLFVVLQLRIRINSMQNI